jgi:hypothetical protein
MVGRSRCNNQIKVMAAAGGNFGHRHLMVAMTFDSVGDGQQQDNGQQTFHGFSNGLRQGGGAVTTAKVAFNSSGSSWGLTAGGGI